ncbi:uncharacterized protein BDW47DRAFT_114356 [Aspergillus candidus]|uniref:Uncharacterized protein n=1 Tax=Aspergillus candidus TaxID=41067 RepID=A0A2I2EXZ1_ASPCN|nr:hypothetical protein BDW47DRAFT_114356 [Aspergillus candidus]PLB33229.1 hypothetical protein BDW47DRAFT_114356 [Aspergillus candidus]
MDAGVLSFLFLFIHIFFVVVVAVAVAVVVVVPVAVSKESVYLFYISIFRITGRSVYWIKSAKRVVRMSD